MGVGGGGGVGVVGDGDRDERFFTAEDNNGGVVVGEALSKLKRVRMKTRDERTLKARRKTKSGAGDAANVAAQTRSSG